MLNPLCVSRSGRQSIHSRSQDNKDKEFVVLTLICLYTPGRCLWDLGRSGCSCSHQAMKVPASHSLWIVAWEGVQGFITVEKIKHNSSYHEGYGDPHPAGAGKKNPVSFVAVRDVSQKKD